MRRCSSCSRAATLFWLGGGEIRFNYFGGLRVDKMNRVTEPSRHDNLLGRGRVVWRFETPTAS